MWIRVICTVHAGRKRAAISPEFFLYLFLFFLILEGKVRKKERKKEGKNE